MIINPSDRVGTVEEYYFSRKLRELAALRDQGYDIINLGIGSPDLPPDQTVIDSMKEHVSQPDLHGYQSYSGRTELRKAFASWYVRWFRVELDPMTEILPLIGSKEGIMHIHMSFINPGDLVLIPNPGYPTYAASARLAGATVVHYDLVASKNWQPDFNQLSDLDWSKIKLMWTNYPHMPTGAKASTETFDRLIQLALDKKVLLCHDNPYSFILNDNPESILARPNAKEVCLELNSLSKSHNMAGWRVGLMAGGKEYLDTVLKFKSNMDSGMKAATQFAAVEALNLDNEWYDRLNRIYRKRKGIAIKIMDQLNCIYDPEGVGMFVWAKIPDSKENAFSYSDRILESSKVFITPGGIFGSNGDRYLRISLCQDVHVLKSALDRVAEIKNVKV